MASGRRPNCCSDLLAGLAPDHGIEVAHHHRIRMRTGHGADDVEGVGDVGHPVAQGLVERVLEGLRTRGHRHHLGTQQLHAVDVDLLPLDVGGTHVDHALEAQAGRHRGRGHAVLAGAGLGDHAGLAHVPGQQCLAHGVVDLVRAGVVEVLALEHDARTADLARQALGVVQRAGPAHVVRQVAVELGHEPGVLAQTRVGRRSARPAGPSGSRPRSCRRRGRNGRVHRARRGSRRRAYSVSSRQARRCRKGHQRNACPGPSKSEMLRQVRQFFSTIRMQGAYTSSMKT